MQALRFLGLVAVAAVSIGARAVPTDLDPSFNHDAPVRIADRFFGDAAPFPDGGAAVHVHDRVVRIDAAGAVDAAFPSLAVPGARLNAMEGEASTRVFACIPVDS